MELWVRSQDKERLVKVDKIELYENKDKTDDEYKKCAIYEYTDNERQYLLGIYKSKERALEVLDEIQKRIEVPKYNMTEEYEKIDLFLKATILNQMTKIYEMPKD